MSFDPNTPAATQRISDTQPIIQTNFAQSNTLTGIDHFQYTYNPAAARGKHKFSTYSALPKIAPADPVAIPTPAVGDGVVYSKTVLAQTIPFYRKDNTVVDFPMLPIRAMGRFNGTTGAAIGTPFNMTYTAGANTGIMVFTLTEPMPDANYLVMVQGSQPGFGGPDAVVNILAPNQFQLRTGGSFGGFQLMIIVLHYAI